jgi:hypothetical protein
MKEIGMLFSGEMVQAILDERKTQTRRLARDCRIDSNGNAWQGKWNFGQDVWGKPHVDRWRKPCDVGDRIYVRETWSYYYFDSDTKKQFYYYKADYPDFEKGFTPEGWDSRPPAAGGDRWYPSIHMPKAAARIWLEVTDMRIEQLLDISSHDANCEGFTEAGTHPRADFLAAWDQLYGNGAAEADPWVWVIEFKQIEVK